MRALDIVRRVRSPARGPARGGGRGDHERRNRERWDRQSDWYQAGHGVEISATPDAWGAWRIPEAELRLLPDLAAKDVLELGCGAGQWSVWLARHGARVTASTSPDASWRTLEAASPPRASRSS